jgi:tetratricopeptide (TPR) repeat protein
MYQYKKTAEAYQKAVNLDPNYAEAQYGLGWSFYHLDRFEDALEPLLIAINLKPNLGAAYFSLGETHAALRNLKNQLTNSRKRFT